MTSWFSHGLFLALGAGSVATAWLVFRTDSMVRAAFWLLASFAAVGAMLVMLGLEFLGFILILMMAGEMAIMAVFMVMFMMNPAGLNPMTMVHQHTSSIVAGVVAFIGLGAIGLFGAFPLDPAAGTPDTTAQLGIELLGDSMLVFQTAGVALLATMIGAIAVAGAQGRFGDAGEGSVEPTLAPEDPDDPAQPPASAERAAGRKSDANAEERKPDANAEATP